MTTTRLLALLAALGACCSWSLLGCAAGGDLGEDGDEVGEDFSPEEGVGEADLLVTSCGVGCLSGYHPTAYSCNLACGLCPPGGYNQTTCVANSSSYTSCGIGCLSGMHPTKYSCNYACGLCPSSGPAGSNNQTTCVTNSGTFTSCGVGCVSGWRATSYSCNYACGLCPPGGYNQTTCTPN